MKTKSGFTIVELLIVIVVIAILAAVSIVAYNGIQSRAKNSQTVSAVSAWAKAIKLYHTDKGVWPTYASCLGEGFPAADGMAADQCANYSSWTRKSDFYTEMQTYLSSVPSPDYSRTVISTDGTNFRRGALYGAGGSYKYIWFTVSGTTCPEVGGLDNMTLTMSYDGMLSCRGRLGSI